MTSPARRRISPVGLANLVVVVLVTALTAVGALVAEDVLPKPPDTVVLVPARLIVFVLLLVLLAAALAWRGTLHRTTGTIFHVQVLDERMRGLMDGRTDDRSRSARDVADRDRMAVRSVTRWLDLRHRADLGDGVIDMVDIADQVGAVLEAQINSDAPETGYSVAPVMPWPLSIAVGTQLPLPTMLTLCELQADPTMSMNTIRLDRGHVLSPIESREQVSGTDQVGARNLGVWITLTAATRQARTDLWAAWGVGEVVRISAGIDLPAETVRLDDRELEGLAAGIAVRLVELRHDLDPGRELVVMALIPKVVALAIGWHIAQQQCAFFAGTHLMYYDREHDDFIPMRVKQSQPRYRPGPA